MSSPSVASEAPAHRSTAVPSYYTLFPETFPKGPPPEGPFDVDLRALRREFLRLQAVAHPDVAGDNKGIRGAGQGRDSGAGVGGSGGGGGRSSSTREAGAASAHINDAYRVLRSPLLRAQYLLHERWGIDVAGDENVTVVGSGGSDAGMAAIDAELLHAVLEAQEEIEEAQSEEELEGPRSRNEERIAACEEALARAFAAEDVASARRETARLRYWVNIRDTLHEWEKDKGSVVRH